MGSGVERYISGGQRDVPDICFLFLDFTKGACHGFQSFSINSTQDFPSPILHESKTKQNIAWKCWATAWFCGNRRVFALGTDHIYLINS